jgi:hypothetical protein
VRRLSLLPPRPRNVPDGPGKGSKRVVRGGGSAVPPRPAAARVERHKFLHRVARRVRSIRPPLTADQQLRLLQLALNVKLTREGKPADAIRLAPSDDPMKSVEGQSETSSGVKR